MLNLVAKQVARQAALQPRLALPAGRTVSLEEGRRLAKLVNDEEERVTSHTTRLLEDGKAESPVVLEDKVSRRILLLRQRQNTDANVKAAVHYAKRRQQLRKAVIGEESAKAQTIAKSVLRKDRTADHSNAVRERRDRAMSRKDTKKQRRSRKQ